MTLDAIVTLPLCPPSRLSLAVSAPLLVPHTASSFMKDSQVLLSLVTAALRNGGFPFHDAATKILLKLGS